MDSNIELIVTGQVGLNLQVIKSGKGAFVDSFYRGTNSEGIEVFLPAEKTLGEDILGAIIKSVDGKDVTSIEALEICRIISTAQRPMKLQFHLSNQRLYTPSNIINFATLPWLLQSLIEIDTQSAESALIVRNKLLCYIDCDRLQKNITLLKKTENNSQLDSFLQEIKENILPSSNLDFNNDNESILLCITIHLREYLNEHLVPHFMKCVAFKRMNGYLHNSIASPNINFGDLLKNQAWLTCFFLFLSKTDNRHLLLLCYLRLRHYDFKKDNHDIIMLLRSAFEICRDSDLRNFRESLKISYQEGAIEDISDFLVLKFVTQFLPAFETSKEYIMMQKSSGDNGYISKLLRAGNNCISTHRKEKLSKSINDESPKTAWTVAMFDTFTDQSSSKHEVIFEEITEDRSLHAKVHINGHIKNHDAIALSSAIDPNSLAPYFVPTKACIFHKKDDRLRNAQSPPPTKLYSMVLTTRDQTLIYACSIVHYRPILLKKGTCDDIHSGDQEAVTNTVGSLTITTIKENEIEKSARHDIIEDFVSQLEADIMPISAGNAKKISVEDPSFQASTFTLDTQETMDSDTGFTDTGISIGDGESREEDMHIKHVEALTSQSPSISDLRECLTKSTIIIEPISYSEESSHSQNYENNKKLFDSDRQVVLLTSEITDNFVSTLDEKAVQGKPPSDILPSDSSSKESSIPIISTVTKESKGISKLIAPFFSQNLNNESMNRINDDDEVVVPTNTLGTFAEFVVATKNTSASVASAIALHAPSWATVDATAKRKGLKFYDKLSQFMDISHETHQDDGSEDQDKESTVKKSSDYYEDKSAISLAIDVSPLTTTSIFEEEPKESYHYVSSLSLLRWIDSNNSSQNPPAIQHSDSELLKGDALTNGSEISGIAYVAYGMCLMTKNPWVVQLRNVVANIAGDYEVAYLATLHDNLSFDEGIELPFLVHEKITKLILSHVEGGYEQKSLAVASSAGIQNFDSQLLFENLSPINLVTVLVAFLLEYRIVVVSSEALSAATHLGEWLKTAIFPLNYSHLFAPLVPPDIGLQLISCPTPYFIGCRRSQAINEVIEMEDERDNNRSKFSKNLQGKGSSCGLLVVDIDYDDCLMPHDLQLPVRGARALIHALESLLRPSLSKCDDVQQRSGEQLDSPALAIQVMDLCRNFVSSLLEGSNYCSLSIEDGDEQIVLFDEALYIHQQCLRALMCTKNIIDIAGKEEVKIEKVEQLRKRSMSSSKEIEPLLQRLLRTQCFSSYLSFQK